MLSFLDAFSGTTQIPMRQPDEENIIFITPHGLYSYRVMPFGLKNAGATYQRLMTKIFKPLIGCIVEVDIDDFVVKSRTRSEHAQHLDEIFHLMRGYNMKLNPTKCVFGVNASKFLVFIVTQRGIEVNPNQIKVVMETSVPSWWTSDCELAFEDIKCYLTQPPILSNPQPDEQLYMYLAVFDYVVSIVYIRCMKDKEQRSIYYAIELSEYGIKYQPRLAMKGQVMADFIAGTPPKFQQSVGSLKKGVVDTKHRRGFPGLGIWNGSTFIITNRRAIRTGYSAQIQGEYEAKDERMAQHLSKEAILLLVYLQAASSIATTPVCNTSETGVGWMHEIEMYL
ncbi:Retrovirus-related Pol polyprotein from transposon 17.6 [Vitis vinifera]|uniref:Retrovirus-related Pol polyprotein from transposon 17.6 n=1 Tax=Vitis vinifera TaxID=29760 RepID=A0A438CW49_VITVI|nr:Retrovirus-related Pol polyprotein from transposon 17.6 [Vitis vinifera]